MRKLSLVVLCVLFLSTTVYSSPKSARSASTKKAPEKTSLELQAIQSREFDTDKKTAFAAVLSVFQDLGYIIGDADLDTGFITAKSATTGKTGFWSIKMTNSSATAFVEQLGKRTKIRLNFVNSQEKSYGYGSKKVTETPLDDPATYEHAFAKIQEAIFIRVGNK
jgi:hypothetical protein